MNQEALVDWDLLPHEPEKFFGLTAEFEISDLKRAYGRLIRKFKPETSPAEFQKIREAYEQLEIGRRYGMVAKARQLQTEAWSEFKAQPKRAVPESIYERAIASPQQAYQDLKAKSPKNPQEFFTLAFLADFCDQQDQLSFIKQLIFGLREHPLDPGLQSLVAGFLENDLELEKAPLILVGLARAVPEGVFYRVTEGLWRRIVRRLGFEQFLKYQQNCEKVLMQTDFTARGAFMLRILRVAMWQVPQEWVDQQFQLIDQHGIHFDVFHEQELEFLKQVWNYQKLLPKHIEGPEQKVVDMIRDYCSLDELLAIQAVYECFNDLSRNVTDLMGAFEVRKECPRYLALYEICDYIAKDVVQQFGGSIFTGSRQSVRSLAEATVVDLAENKEKAFERVAWSYWRALAGAFLVTVLGVPYLVSLVLPENYQWLAIVLALASGVFFFVFFKPVVIEKWWNRRIHAILLAEYSRSWRARLVRYVQACHVPTQVVVEEFIVAGRNLDEEDLVNLVSGLATSDPVVYLLSISQQFVR